MNWPSCCAYRMCRRLDPVHFHCHVCGREVLCQVSEDVQESHWQGPRRSMALHPLVQVDVQLRRQAKEGA
jgi:hypothetical protein